MAQQRNRKIESSLTMQSIAEIAGVSTITVSRALRGSPLVTDKTREKIQAIAQQQGYRFNISARNLRLRSSYSVAVVVEMSPAKDRPMSGHYPLELLGGITQELTSAGFSAVLTSKQLINTPPVQGADGIILLGQGSHGEAVKQIQGCGLPLVVWGAPHKDFECIVVGSDNRTGGAQAAERFKALKRKKLVFLGDIDHAEVEERYAGFIDAMGRTGKNVICLKPDMFTFESGSSCVSQFLHEHGHDIDGIFAVSDLLAMGAIHALTEAEISVPDAVSVIGYDDTPHAASFVPPLTSVHQYLHDGGVLLAKKMLALIHNEEVSSEKLPTTLVIRQT
ncbi:LacI family DNA-binding transcriptional regulator [Sapientia aquatica]|uniref:LacI family transcriptional regulator n=1 Tax=Sapientia aquatica TaxID=1549640 RepID=A0A4R5VZ41_9BURK|nr:LacI family DNA-binding transcriptional regulator [Sapientia aquatica]TDK64421.1 LacI family transcriptional regulator [Sapientia aquatica]